MDHSRRSFGSERAPSAQSYTQNLYSAGAPVQNRFIPQLSPDSVRHSEALLRYPTDTTARVAKEGFMKVVRYKNAYDQAMDYWCDKLEVDVLTELKQMEEDDKLQHSLNGRMVRLSRALHFLE